MNEADCADVNAKFAELGLRVSLNLLTCISALISEIPLEYLACGKTTIQTAQNILDLANLELC